MFRESVAPIKMKGHYKISLFEKGELIKEAKGHNFITKTAIELMKRYQAGLVGAGISGMDSKSIDIPNGFDPFGRLILTDGTEPEDELNDVFLWGNNIGSAVRKTPYSGASKVLGTINSSESFANDEKTHLVFDFPTHACNGNINSLGFVSDGENISGVKFELARLKNNYSYWSQACIVGDEMYLNYHSGNRELRIVNIKTKEDRILDLGVINKSIFNIGENMYVIKTPYNSSDIFKLSLDRKTITEEKLVLSKEIPNLQSLTCVNNKLYVSSTANTNDVATGRAYKDSLYIFSTTGVYERNVPLPSSPSSSSSSSSLGSGVIQLTLNQGKVVYNTVTDEIKPSEQFGNGGVAHDDRNGKVYVLDTYSLYRLFPSTLATKIVLPETVVKTNAQTMKIEYDFTY